MAQKLHKRGAVGPSPRHRAISWIPHRARGVALSSVDPEGPHQVRVGPRRFRTGLNVLGKTDAEARRLADEARWLAGEIGILRDLDVVRGEMIRPRLAGQPDEAGLLALDAALWSVLCGPDSAGASRHRKPLRLVKIIPLGTRVSSTRGLPWELGKKGFSLAICTSLSQ